MIEWNEDLKKAPKGNKPFLVKEYRGLCSGGWDWYKALRIGNDFFNIETKERIEDPHSWAPVNL